jgi:hypothetical protein
MNTAGAQSERRQAEAAHHHRAEAQSGPESLTADAAAGDRAMIEVETSTEPIVDWRCWYLPKSLTPETVPHLQSVVTAAQWQHGKAFTSLDVDRNGIHAFKLRTDAARYIEPNEGNRDRFLYRRVYGSVYLWGKVIECEFGYRAEFAYPKSLLVERVIRPGMAERDLPSELRALYGCETSWMTNAGA